MPFGISKKTWAKRSKLIDEMYAGSLDGFFGMNNNGLDPDEVIKKTLRIEEITRILDAIRLEVTTPC